MKEAVNLMKTDKSTNYPNGRAEGGKDWKKIEHMSITDSCNNIKRSNIYVIRVRKDRRKTLRQKNHLKSNFEKAKNFPNLVKNIKPQIQECQQTPSRIHKKKITHNTVQSQR